MAARRPKHLSALCVCHGWSDFYRDATRAAVVSIKGNRPAHHNAVDRPEAVFAIL